MMYPHAAQERNHDDTNLDYDNDYRTGFAPVGFGVERGRPPHGMYLNPMEQIVEAK
jgi:hypothetical protein